MRGPVEAELIIRAPVASDAEGAAAVWYAGEDRALAESYPGGYPSEWFWMGTVEGAAEHLAEVFAPAPRAAAWVAELAGRVVGIAATGPARDQADGTELGNLRTLYVLPDAWGTGVGGALHAEALTHLRAHFTSAELWVIHGNARARAFYQRRGWQPTGEFNHPKGAPPLVRYTHDLA